MSHFERRIWGWAACATIAVVLAGCATIQNSLDAKDIAALRIVEAEVLVTPATTIWWGNGEREFVEKVKAGQAHVGALPVKKAALQVGSEQDPTGDYNRIIESPEAQQYLRDRLRSMIEQRVRSDVLPQFQGTRAAKLEVHVVNFTIPSPLQRVALGGTPVMGAVTVLKDAETGKELAKMDRVASGVAGTGLVGVLADQAFADLEVRVLDNYVTQVRGWLGKN
ncbi:MAG: hypothetical protein AB7E80_16180 [Hyphomicrobiaceae bacterium]